jgi:hypothetical protein
MLTPNRIVDDAEPEWAPRRAIRPDRIRSPHHVGQKSSSRMSKTPMRCLIARLMRAVVVPMKDMFVDSREGPVADWLGTIWTMAMPKA